MQYSQSWSDHTPVLLKRGTTEDAESAQPHPAPHLLLSGLTRPQCSAFPITSPVLQPATHCLLQQVLSWPAARWPSHPACSWWSTEFLINATNIIFLWQLIDQHHRIIKDLQDPQARLQSISTITASPGATFPWLWNTFRNGDSPTPQAACVHALLLFAAP